MTVFEELDTASFKGVKFFVPAETSTAGGRKKVVHEYINSDRRTVEDQGLFREVFTVRGIITDFDGQYFQRRNALLNVLKEAEEGVLSHPFYGKRTVVSDKYTIVESFKELGRADFSMLFYDADDKAEPLPDAFTDFNVQETKNVVIEFVGLEIIDNFKVSDNFPFNFSEAVSLFEKVGAAFDEITTTFDRALAEINNFAAQLNNFRNNILRLVNLPSQLVASLTNLYNSAVALARTPEEAFLTLQKFFGFGDDAVVILPTTAERIERIANNGLINQYIQVGALAFAYGQAVDIDFFTIREIDVYAEKLEDQYNKVFPLLSNNDLAAELRSLRVTANEFLDGERLNVKRIVEFETQPTTLQELSYRLYGNLDAVEKLAALNGIKDADFISGTLEIFR